MFNSFMRFYFRSKGSSPRTASNVNDHLFAVNTKLQLFLEVPFRGGVFKVKRVMPSKSQAQKLPAHLVEGRDDAPKLGLGKTELKFARMTSKEAFKPAKGGQSDSKWVASVKARAHLAGENPSGKMKSMDKAGRVPSAIKDSAARAQVVVAALLND